MLMNPFQSSLSLLPFYICQIKYERGKRQKVRYFKSTLEAIQSIVFTFDSFPGTRPTEL